MKPVAPFWAPLVWLSPLQEAWTWAGADQTFSPRQQRLQQPDGSRLHGLQSQREGPSGVSEWAQTRQGDWGESQIRVRCISWHWREARTCANRVQVLTVLRSPSRTISVTVHMSPGLHQTAVKIWRRELMEDSLKITMWDLIFLWCFLDNYSHHSEPHFPVMKQLNGLLSVCICVHLPPAPFQNALKPSSLRIFLKQSMTPLYVVWPALAATWSLVLMTSAGVTSEAAGTP